MNSYRVSYSFKTASGEVAHHYCESGLAISKEDAVNRVLPYLTQYVRDNLVSISAMENALNQNGDLPTPRQYR